MSFHHQIECSHKTKTYLFKNVVQWENTQKYGSFQARNVEKKNRKKNYEEVLICVCLLDSHL